MKQVPDIHWSRCNRLVPILDISGLAPKLERIIEDNSATSSFKLTDVLIPVDVGFVGFDFDILYKFHFCMVFVLVLVSNCYCW